MHSATEYLYAPTTPGLPDQTSSCQPLYLNYPAPLYTAQLNAHYVAPPAATTVYPKERRQISQLPPPLPGVSGYPTYIAVPPSYSMPFASQQPLVQTYSPYHSNFLPTYVPFIPNTSQQPAIQTYPMYHPIFPPICVSSIPDASQQPQPALQTHPMHQSHVTPTPSIHNAGQQPPVQTCHQTYASHQALVSSMIDHGQQPWPRQPTTASPPTATDPVGLVLLPPQPQQLYASPVQSLTATASDQQSCSPLYQQNDVAERQALYSTRGSQLASRERIIQQLRAAKNPIPHYEDDTEIWNAKVKEYFGHFLHDFRAEPVGANDLDLLKASCIFYSDKAKIRFHCQTCQNRWTSMKGRVEFYVSDPRIPSTEHGVMKRVEVVRYKLFGQDCLKCSATNRRKGQLQWFREEIKKVVLNLSFHIEKVVYGAQNVPEPINENRAGRPRTYHSREGCQACKEGLACPAYRPSSNFQPHQNPTRPQPVSTDASLPSTSPVTPTTEVSAVSPAESTE